VSAGSQRGIGPVAVVLSQHPPPSSLARGTADYSTNAGQAPRKSQQFPPRVMNRRRTPKGARVATPKVDRLVNLVIARLSTRGTITAERSGQRGRAIPIAQSRGLSRMFAADKNEPGVTSASPWRRQGSARILRGLQDSTGTLTRLPPSS